MPEVKINEPVSPSHGKNRVYCWPDNPMQCENDVAYSFWFTSPYGLCSSTGACEHHARDYMIAQFSRGNAVNTILVNIGQPELLQYDLGPYADKLEIIELTFELAKKARARSVQV